MTVCYGCCRSKLLPPKFPITVCDGCCRSKLCPPKLPQILPLILIIFYICPRRLVRDGWCRSKLYVELHFPFYYLRYSQPDKRQFQYATLHNTKKNQHNSINHNLYYHQVHLLHKNPNLISVCYTKTTYITTGQVHQFCATFDQY